MKHVYAAIGFVVLGMVTFRVAYGAWPPFERDVGQWLSSDPRAGWSTVAAIVGAIVGALIGRAVARD